MFDDSKQAQRYQGRSSLKGASMNKDSDNSEAVLMKLELNSLAVDLKRMLRVQFKEFVHHIEDVEFEQGCLLSPDVATAKTGKSFQHVA